MESGDQLTVFNMNKAGQKLLGFVLPELFEHLGGDIMNNMEIYI